MKKILLALAVMLTGFQVSAQCSILSSPTNNCAGFGDRIDTYMLNNIASTSSSGCGLNGYSASNQTWTLTPGGVYSFSSAVGGGVYSEALVIWIDVNNDAQYAATEALYVGSSAATHSGTIQIPSNIVLNTNLRMRVMCSYGTMTGSSACTSNLNSYGETEDYYVYCTCPTTSTVNVASTNSFICQGQSATFTASAVGANSYTWVGVGNGSVVTVTPGVTTAYTVIAGNTSCAGSTFTAVRTISVTNVPLAVSAAASNTSICAGTSATLNAVGATNYTWLPGSISTASTIVSPSANLTYTLLGYNGTGCPGATTLALAVKPAPTVAAVANASAICSGNSATFTASGALTYTWNGNSSLTGSTVVLTPSTSIAVQVVGTNSLGCSAAANTVIIVLAAPPVVATAAQTLVCMGQSVTINATGASTYSWNNGSTGSSAVYTPTGLTQVVVSGFVSGNICPGNSTVTINATQPTVVAIASPTAICIGKTATLNATGADNYTFSSMFNSVNPTVTTVYTVTGEATIDNLTCTGETTVQVVVNPNPTITATPDRTTMCKGETATVTAGGGVSYNWTGATTGSASTSTVNPNLAQTMVFNVSGTDANGCVSSATASIKVNACTGLNEQSGVAFNVYPNPTSGNIIISTERAMTITLTDVSGKMVAEYQLQAGANSLNVNHLSNGVYFINGNSGSELLREKLILNK